MEVRIGQFAKLVGSTVRTLRRTAAPKKSQYCYNIHTFLCR